MPLQYPLTAIKNIYNIRICKNWNSDKNELPIFLAHKLNKSAKFAHFHKKAIPLYSYFALISIHLHTPFLLFSSVKIAATHTKKIKINVYTHRIIDDFLCLSKVNVFPFFLFNFFWLCKKCLVVVC